MEDFVVIPVNYSIIKRHHRKYFVLNNLFVVLVNKA